jgi:hypothetical protein|eukprot:SAG25_NODE_419_length_8245_cov_3.527744_8_plen_105_part_00
MQRLFWLRNIEAQRPGSDLRLHVLRGIPEHMVDPVHVPLGVRTGRLAMPSVDIHIYLFVVYPSIGSDCHTVSILANRCALLTHCRRPLGWSPGAQGYFEVRDMI